MTKDMLWRLRMEICLCSLYYADYRNSFDIDEHAASNFMDGYADYLSELMNADSPDRGDNHFFDCFEENPLPEPEMSKEAF